MSDEAKACSHYPAYCICDKDREVAVAIAAERARNVAQLRESSVKLDARDKNGDPKSIYSHDAAMCRAWADMIKKGESDD